MELNYLWKSDFNLQNTFNTETFNLVDDFNLLRRLMSEFRFTSKFLFTDCLEFQLTNTISMLIYCVYRISISIYQHNTNLLTVQIFNLPVDVHEKFRELSIYQLLKSVNRNFDI